MSTTKFLTKVKLRFGRWAKSTKITSPHYPLDKTKTSKKEPHQLAISAKIRGLDQFLAYNFGYMKRATSSLFLSFSLSLSLSYGPNGARSKKIERGCWELDNGQARWPPFSGQRDFRARRGCAEKRILVFIRLLFCSRGERAHISREKKSPRRKQQILQPSYPWTGLFASDRRFCLSTSNPESWRVSFG